MKPKWFRKENLPELIILSLVLVCAVLVIRIHMNPGMNRMAQPVDPLLILEPEAVEEESIADYAGVRYTYTFTLPDLSRGGASDLRLTAFLRHMYVSLTVDGSAFQYETAEAEGPHIGRTPGKYWVSIPLRPEFSGKAVRITLTPVFSNALPEDLEFALIHRDTLLTMVTLPQDAILLVLGALAVIAGLILAVMILFIPAEAREKKLVFYTGLVTILASLWKLSGLPVIPLLLDYLGIHKEIWYGGTVCYMLMLVFSLRMVTFMDQEQPGKAGVVCTCIAAGAAFLLVILQVFGVLELHHVVVWFGVGVAVLHLVTLLKTKSGRSKWLWVLPFLLSLAVDLLISLRTGSMHKAFVFMLWMMLNLVIRGFGFIRLAVLREKMLRKKEEKLRDARIQSMMNQIRPHFIYNTLASIYLLCREDPDQAAAVVGDFTKYLQGNFSAISAANPVSFSEELRHTQAYLAVEKALYRNKLNVEFDTEYTAFRLPPLTLQPIAENAVKHGMNHYADPLHVLIHTRHTDAGSVITVEDNGPGFDPSDEKTPHTTLENIRQRLEMMCHGKLEVTPRNGGGTTVTITIPDRNAEE